MLPLFVLFGGMGSPEQENPSTPADLFPMIFMMKAMENPDGNYRTTIEEQIALALQYEMMIRNSGPTLMGGIQTLLAFAKYF